MKRDPFTSPVMSDLWWDRKARKLICIKEVFKEYMDLWTYDFSEMDYGFRETEKSQPIKSKVTVHLVRSSHSMPVWSEMRDQLLLLNAKRDPFKEPEVGDMFWFGSTQCVFRITSVSDTWVEWDSWRHDGRNGSGMGSIHPKDFTDFTKKAVLLYTDDGFTLTKSDEEGK